MTWLQFIASLIDSVTWPAAIAVAVFFLRKPIIALIPNLRTLKYKGLEVNFGEKLERLEQELKDEPPLAQIEPPSDRQTFSDERFESLLEISPNAAILEAWNDIEQALRELAEAKNIDEHRGQSILYLSRVLRSREIISSRLAGMLDELRLLRNAAAHPTGERQLLITDVRRYKEVADQVRKELHAALY